MWRFEGSLTAGSTIFTPIFDVVPDGRPTGSPAAFIRVASPYFRIVVVTPFGAASNNPGGRLEVFTITDIGSTRSAFRLYVQPRSGGGANVYRYESVSRRCRFQLVNATFGGSGLTQDYQVEIVAEGLDA